MGDRANIQVVDMDRSSVFLYTHWQGSELPGILQVVLKRHRRWDDGPYLARIIFSEMIRHNLDGEDGFGISANVGDGDDRILVVDIKQRTVQRVDRTDLTYPLKKMWTFEAYCQLNEEAIGNAWNL